MMQLTVEDQLNEIIDIEEFTELLGWELKKQGRYYRGCCPLHGGDNPTAFSYSIRKRRFYCATRCGGVGSYVFAYAKAKRITIEKAIVELAKWKKITLKGRKRFIDAPKIVEKKVKTEHQSAIITLPIIPPSERRDLFPLRGNARFSNAVIDRFRIKQAKKGRYANRIVFPIYDHQGRWVGNNGRWIGEDYAQRKTTKYLYSPEPFESRYILYGAHLAKDADYYLLHEGVTDVAKAFEHGYTAEAILGSYLSEEQVEIMRQNPKPIILGFDGDEAGRKVTKQAIELLFQKHLTDVSVMLFSEGQDPGSTKKTEYDEVFQKRIPALDYLRRQLFVR